MDLIKGFHGEFAWFIWGMIALAFVWFFTGGTESPTAREGAYIEPPAPLDSGEAYGTYYEGRDIEKDTTLNLPRTPGKLFRLAFSPTYQRQSIAPAPTVQQRAISTAILTKQIYFKDFGRAKESSVDGEYLRIEADPDSRDSQMISGLILRGAGKNTSIIIPKASNLPITGITPSKNDAYLAPGGQAVITTGRSPIGTSFRVNKCMGYLDQFQNFIPDLDKSCPLPSDELKASGLSNDPVCAEFVQTIPRCRIYQGAPPKNLSRSCVGFLAEELNYNACVANHKNDKDFYSNEWRLFLNQNDELWKNRDEIIRLMDSKGMVLDAITY